MHFEPSPAGFHPVRHNQLFEESEHDAYARKYKPAEPAVCPDCGSIFHAGRWQWGVPHRDAEEIICPACHRIRDHFPAGFVHIGGQFFADHRSELMHLIRHHEERTMSEHPLKRIMDIEDEDDGILVTTTDIHLARDLGDALHHAYQGELEFHYNDAENLLRVHWHR